MLQPILIQRLTL